MAWRIHARLELVPIEWSAATPVAGALLASPDGSPLPAGIGMLASAPYEHSRPRAFLGVQFAREPGPVRLESVLPDTPAAAAGLQSDDVIAAIDQVSVADTQTFRRRLAERRPGDRVRLQVQRAGQQIEVEVELHTDRRVPTNTQERIWGPLSGVRTGFALVLQHDTVLTPEQCGGPLIGLDGRALGVNIARAGRVETLALPAASVQAAVGRMLAAAGPR